jgi:hypothetical protein
VRCDAAMRVPLPSGLQLGIARAGGDEVVVQCLLNAGLLPRLMVLCERGKRDDRKEVRVVTGGAATCDAECVMPCTSRVACGLLRRRCGPLATSWRRTNGRWR